MKIRRDVTTPETEGGDEGASADTKVRGACSVCKIAHTACDGYVAHTFSLIYIKE